MTVSNRPIIKVSNGKIMHTGKIKLPDGTISVQPEGGIKFIPQKLSKKRPEKKAKGGTAGGKKKMMGGGKV